MPGDEFSDDLDVQWRAIKELFLGAAYNRVFDLLQFIMRHELVPDGFREYVVATLQECMCAYAVIEGEWIIVPTAIPEQRKLLRMRFASWRMGRAAVLGNISASRESASTSVTIREVYGRAFTP